MKQLKVLGALLRKELKLMKRDPNIPVAIFILPLVVMLIFPLVANFDVKHIEVAVVDNDRSELSRRIISDMGASEFMDIAAAPSTHALAVKEMEKGTADIIMTIPQNYEADIVRNGKIPDIDVETNGVNATKGVLGSTYVTNSIVESLQGYAGQYGLKLDLNNVSEIYRFNPTLNSHHYMIPALMVVIIVLICGFLPAVNLVNEKETGSIESMNVAPVSKFVFVLSKVVIFWVVALGILTMGILVGGWVYDVWPVGNLFIIYTGTLLFGIVISELGVAIANTSNTILQAIFVIFAFVVVYILMGGIFTPIPSMPQWAQDITIFVPTRYYSEILRSVYLKASSWSDLSQHFAALGIFAGVLLILCALTYRKRN